MRFSLRRTRPLNRAGQPAPAPILEDLESRTFLSATPAGPSGAAVFITSVYQDLLARAPDAAGLQSFTTLLQNGADHAAVAQAIEGSAEYDTRLLGDFYVALLHRTADPGGLAAFSAAIQNGTTLEQVQAILLGSDEYFAARSQGTNDGFIAALYQDALGRTPDSAGLAGFTAQLAAGTTRQQVAAAVLGSGEYQQALVRSMYGQFVGREPAAPELLAALTGFQQGATDQAVLADIVGSNTYFGVAVKTYGTAHQKFVVQAYEDLLGRDAEPAGFAAWSAGLDDGTLTAGQMIRALEGTAEYRTHTVQDLYGQLLGRAADPAGSAAFATLLSQGATHNDVVAPLVCSAEYYARQGGTNATWVHALSADLLGQPADPTARAGYVQDLDAGTPRAAIAGAILDSDACRRALVTQLYQKYLGRTPDSGGLDSFAALLAHGATTEAVIAVLASSSEYQAKA